MYLTSLTRTEQAALLYTWQWWARSEQIAPSGRWFTWLLLAGRGWGKTRTLCEWIRGRIESGRYGRVALIGQTAADVRDVLIEGESGLLAISPPWCHPKYEPSKRRLTWPNGAIATTYSGDSPDQLRGPQHDTVACDELAKWQYPQETWDNMEFGLRLGPQPQVCVATTPRPIPVIRALRDDPTTVRPTSNLNTYTNLANVNPLFIERVVKKYEGTRLGRQELNAEILDDNPDALWKRTTMIEPYRVPSAPDLVRIVVGIDPTATATGDEAGIIVAGLGANGHGYILEDRSRQGTPTEWASSAVTAYHHHRADRLIAETNNGGEMVVLTIRTVPEGKSVAYKGIHASRGKYTRAEPVSSLYEQGKVHHVGAFPQLEDELCSWTPGDDSPNRLDALVWALTELMIKRAPDEKERPGTMSVRGGRR